MVYACRGQLNLHLPMCMPPIHMEQYSSSSQVGQVVHQVTPDPVHQE